MTVGYSEAEANAHVLGFDTNWVQIHIGDPGADGTANPATETDRRQISLGTPSGGVVSNDAVIEWDPVDGAQTPTHASLWTASTAGELMAITFVQATFSTIDEYHDYTLSSAPTDGNILLFIGNFQTAGDVSDLTAEGFTVVFNRVGANDAVLAWKEASGDSAALMNLASSGFNDAGIVAEYSGVDTTTPIEDSDWDDDFNDSVAVAVTAGGDGRVHVIGVSMEGSTDFSSDGFTERLDDTTAGRTQLHDKVATSGVNGPFTDSGTLQTQVVFSFLLNPTAASNVAPGDPTGVAATAADSQATVTWSDGTIGVPEETYDVDRGTTSIGPWTSMATGLARSTQTYTDTSAANGTEYFYRVRGTNSEAHAEVVDYDGLEDAGSSATEGTAAFSGAGTMAAGGDVGVSGTAAFTGTGGMVATGVPNVDGAVAFAGAGTMAAGGDAGVSGTAAFSGTGTMVAQGVPNVDGAAAFSGNGILAAIGETDTATQGAAAFSGAGDLTVDGDVGAVGAVAFAGVGTMAATADTGVSGTAEFSGTGSMAAVGETDSATTGTAAFAGAGDLSVQGVPNVDGVAAFSGSGAMVAVGETDTATEGTAAFAGAGTMAATGDTGVSGTAGFSGVGNLVAQGVAGIDGAAAFAGAGDLAAQGDVGVTGTAVFLGAGDLSAQGVAGSEGTAGFSGVGSLTIEGQTTRSEPGTVKLQVDRPTVGLQATFKDADEQLADPTTVEVSARLPGGGTLSGSGTQASTGVYTWSPDGPLPIGRNVVRFTGTGTVQARAEIVIIVDRPDHDF
eukprot:g16136.t1